MPEQVGLTRFCQRSAFDLMQTLATALMHAADESQRLATLSGLLGIRRSVH